MHSTIPMYNRRLRDLIAGAIASIEGLRRRELEFYRNIYLCTSIVEYIVNDINNNNDAITEALSGDSSVAVEVRHNIKIHIRGIKRAQDCINDNVEALLPHMENRYDNLLVDVNNELMEYIAELEELVKLIEDSYEQDITSLI